MQGSSWALTLGEVASPSRKIREKGEVIVQSYHIFYQFRSTLVITRTVAIKWKEKYHAVVVNCHHSWGLCGDRMKNSLPKKNFFLGDSHFSLGPI